MLLAVSLLSAFLVLATLVPYLPISHGLVRVGAFPLQQVMGIALIMLVGILVARPAGASWLAIEVVLALIVVIQLWQILPYTPLWTKESLTYDAGRDSGDTVTIVSSNVKMSNDDYQGLSDVIAAEDPDIVILMEVNEKWLEGVRGLTSRYEHVVPVPQDDSYGLLLASRLPLSNVTVRFVLTENVPSIVATVETSGGRKFRLYVVHPEPPVPSRETDGRDGEMSLVAFETRDEGLPVAVTGDLNDVAWSVTTKRFRRISQLLDPRIGRKVFSTFDARFPLVRWPLDHLFHSPEFRVKGMKRLKPCGSDHFPVRFDLVLCSEPEAESHPDAADGYDVERAEELVEGAERRDGPAIGSDWES